MSNVTIHLVIPVLVLLATRLFPTKQVLMWAPFAVVPDLDTAIDLFTHYFMETTVFGHRAVLHNVFVFIPTLILAMVLWFKMLGKEPTLQGSTWYEKWIAFGQVRWGYASVLVTFYLSTHVLLDTFTGGTTLLWPLLNVYVYPQLFIYVDMATGLPSASASVTTGAGAPTLSSRYPWMTPEQVAIWIIVLIGAIAAMAREAVTKKYKIGVKRPVVVPRKLEESPLVDLDANPAPAPVAADDEGPSS